MRAVYAFPFFDENTQWQYIGTVTFPTQYAGLRVFYDGSVQDLCLVAEGDAPTAFGGVLKIVKNDVTYDVYLVDVIDPNASHVFVFTTQGVRAVRLLT